jgi:hypothetical protein
MSFSSLQLSIDSFIVALALSVTVSRRYIPPLIVLFGACDALGSAIGPSLGMQLPLIGLLPSIFWCCGED